MTELDINTNKITKLTSLNSLDKLDLKTSKLDNLKGKTQLGLLNKLSVKGLDIEWVQAKFVTKLMQKGKKEKAEQIFLKALKKVEQDLKKKQSLKKETNQDIIKKEQALINPKGEPKLMKLKSKKNILVSKSLSNEVSQTKSVVVSSSFSKKTDLNLSLVKLLEKIIEKAKPLVRLKKVRIAGTTHQKPVALTQKQAETDAIKRIITNANARSEKSATLKLAKEFEEIYLNVLSNKTLTEIRDLHKLAELNKANITLKS